MCISLIMFGPEKETSQSLAYKVAEDPVLKVCYAEEEAVVLDAIVIDRGLQKIRSSPQRSQSLRRVASPFGLRSTSVRGVCFRCDAILTFACTKSCSSCFPISHGGLIQTINARSIGTRISTKTKLPHPSGSSVLFSWRMPPRVKWLRPC